MNIKKHIPFLPFIGVLTLTALGLHYATTRDPLNSFFHTERAHKRTLIPLVKAAGILVPEEIIKIGNLINGIMRALYVQENELVQEGQLLAEIDDSREDTDVNASFGSLDAAQAVLSYQLEFLKRQQELFKYKQVSLDGLQQAEQEYEAAYAKVEQAKALYELAKLTYNNKRIYSPASGMIISKNVTVGQAVSNFSPAVVIYAIAKNIHELKAHIFLNTNDLAVLKINTPVLMILDTDPHKTFPGTITEITAIPHEMELTDYTYARLIPKTEKPVHHCAIVPVDNSELSLRPGMTFNTQITADEKDNVLSIPHEALTISNQDVEQLATRLKYAYKPLTDTQLLEVSSNPSAKAIWTYKNKAFIEKTVITGIKDADYTEIIDGLDGSEDIVTATL